MNDRNADDRPSDADHRITTDRDTIRGWAGENDATPVRYSGVEGESGELRIVPESDRGESHERLEWEDFFDAIDRDDEVVVTRGSGSDRTFEVIDRDEAVGRSALAGDEVEDALAAGETVTTEVTETTVVEETVVERAEIESELLDRRLVEERVLDAELLAREVVDCEVTEVGGEGATETYEDVFEVGYTTTGGYEVTIDVEESWSVTKEAIERVGVESRVVEADEETEAVGTDAVDTRVDPGEVERTIVESGVLDATDVDAADVDRKSIRSEFVEGETIVTELLERGTIDEELTVRRRLRGDVDEGETTDVQSVRREVVDREMTEADEYEVGEIDTERYGAGAEGTAAASGTGATGADESVRTTPEENDKGKTVVDRMDEEIGIVSDVRDDTLYVDPHPSLTDRIRARLDWGGMDEDSYPVEPDRIERITHDRVRLRFER